MIYAAVVQEHKDVIKVVSAETPESLQAFAQGVEFGADLFGGCVEVWAPEDAANAGSSGGLSIETIADIDVMCSAAAAIDGDA